MTEAVTEARLTAALSEVRQQILDSNNDLVTQCRENANHLHNHQNLDFKIKKEKFVREYEAMKGEFCIIGYSWKTARPWPTRDCCETSVSFKPHQNRVCQPGAY